MDGAGVITLGTSTLKAHFDEPLQQIRVQSLVTQKKGNKETRYVKVSNTASVALTRMPLESCAVSSTSVP